MLCLGAVVNILPLLFAKVKPSISEVGAENELYFIQCF